MRSRKIISAILSAAMLVSLGGCVASSQSETTSQAAATAEKTEEATTVKESETEKSTSETEAETTAEETTAGGGDYTEKGTLTGKTAQEIVCEMGVGFNIGNTMDAKSKKGGIVKYHETAWGNPIISQELVDSIAEAGFTTVRVPTTWEAFISDDGSYTIDSEYMARVTEVVDYCYEKDMYVILNIHHEDWLENKAMIIDQDKIGQELQAVWEQIADNFAGYDQHLIFEGMNEPRLKGSDIEWNGNSAAYETINYFNQIFVNTIRKNGKGHNAERCLMIPGYAASNSASVMKAVALPTVDGEVPENLIMSVHSYSPYEFCLNTTKKTFSLDNTSDTSAIDSVFAAIKDQYLDNGIPVVIGETGATGKDDVSQRVNWAAYMSQKAAEYGVPIVLWDNGVSGTTKESHKYFDRTTGELLEPEIVAALVNKRKETEWGSALVEKEETESIVGGKVIAAYAEGNKATAEWNAAYICTAANDLYFMEGNKIEVIYKGEGSPKMILDSEELSQWWMAVDPDSIEEYEGYSIAVFGYDSIKKVLDSFDVEKPSQLRNMSFVSTEGLITTYEVALLAEKNVICYYVNGQVYETSDVIPEGPVLDKYEFLGWYTTKNYKPGTELTKENMDGVTTAYAKLALK